MTASTTAGFGLRQRQPRVALGCILVSLFFIGSVIAQEKGTGYVSPREPQDDYFDAIDRIESEHGPYATELSDLFLGLGQALMNSGDYEQARDAFNRGAMVMRVNSGPNSPEQTNHLYLIANIETLLGEFEAADDILHNIYFINSKHYGDDNPEMLPVLEKMFEWYVVTRPPGSDVAEYEDYVRTTELTEKMVLLSEAARGKEHPDTALAYRRLGEAQFQTVRYMWSRGLYLATSSGSLESRAVVEQTIRDHYDAGRQAFDKYLELLSAQEPGKPLKYAEALADLADWYLAFRKFGVAWNHYRQAYQVLAQNEEYAKLADSYMSQPKPAHFLGPQSGFLQDAPPELQEMSLDITMTVTNYGSPRHVEVMNAPEGISEEHLGEIKRQVQGIPFRPALKAGEVVTIEDFIWQYTVVPLGRSS